MFRVHTAFRSMFLASAVALAGCASVPTEEAGPSTIIRGGPILTMEGDQPAYVEAVVVDGGKIVFAGSDAEAMARKGTNTVVKDLGGKALLPGFIDPHSHFIDSLALADRVNVSGPPVGPASNPDEIVAALQEGAAAKSLKPGELLLGWGYDENLMPKGQVLSREILDKAFPDNPVGVIHVSMHGAVINSKAMELYGYKDGMPTPAGGVILRRPGTQELQGLVMEAGYLPMHAKLPSPNEEQEMAAARSGQLLYAAAGVTTAQEGATTQPMLQQLQRVASNDGLIIDVIAYPFIVDLESILKSNPPSTFGKYNQRLKIGGCKVTVDGSPQGKTAWFTTPYLTGGPGGEKDWKGEPSIPLDAIGAMVKTCYDNDLQVLMHGNGDAAIDFIIATHQEMAGADIAKDRRTTCIHCQFIRPDQIAAFAKMKIIPSLFTDHTFFFGDTHVANRGPKQSSFISPMKAAIDAGLRPTNHTDAFVVPIDQLMTVWTAVNRQLRSGGTLGADQRITAYQALQAITINAAYQYREEASKGSIAVGKRADLVILSADPTKVAPEAIKDIKVIETLKDGKTIYSQP
ncbi:metal-dependent hydrolase [Sphingopyxis fribergensis]|uniref:Metal-dependent hydrolase n=2 Tax=Sphingopyxis fribergensis TaxID=1515612 RepID=A0A0A7PKM5_9SPHN|nr:metal-dependent hydrolase [Sphingopyxis fribergensis]